MSSNILLIAGIIFCIFVIIFSIKTMIDTRKKYYDDYIRRKRDEKH